MREREASYTGHVVGDSLPSTTRRSTTLRLRRLAGWLHSCLELEGSGKHRILPMEGLRGFSIILVFFVHYSLAVAPWVPTRSTAFQVMRGMSGIGNAGVDLFFLLSGYLIYGTLIRRPQPVGRYLWRRVRRIYPTFLVVLSIYIGLSLLAPAYSKLPESLLARCLVILENALLLPGIVQVAPIVGVAWSLSYEMFFYLSLPLLIGAFALRSRSRAYRMTFFLVMFAAIVVFAAIFHAMHVRLIMFVAGILLNEVIGGRQLNIGAPNAFSTATAAIVVIGLAAVWVLRGSRTASGSLTVQAGMYPASEIAEAFVLFGSFFVLALCTFATNGWLTRLFSLLPLRLLGNMSYSYYLIHNLTLRVFFFVVAMVLPPTGHRAAMFWLSLPIAFGVTLIPSLLLYLLVERPISLAPSSGHRAPTIADTSILQPGVSRVSL